MDATSYHLCEHHVSRNGCDNSFIHIRRRHTRHHLFIHLGVEFTLSISRTFTFWRSPLETRNVLIRACGRVSIALVSQSLCSLCPWWCGGRGGAGSQSRLFPFVRFARFSAYLFITLLRSKFLRGLSHLERTRDFAQI